jgi:Uma2 family endonuclease
MEPLRKEYYTYEQWLSWDESVRAELYEGTLIMHAQPSQRHQSVLGEIYGQLWQFLKGKSCKAFIAPFGVRLNNNEDTVFEPDIVIICDKSKLDGKLFHGAPDMIIEIISPSTERMDRIYKYRKYQQAGVREYWIVEPKLNLLQVGVLHNDAYIVSIYEQDDKVRVSVLEGCEINLTDVFSEE